MAHSVCSRGRIAVLRTKKELPVSEYMDRGYVSLISHPYSDSLAPYLGTAILTILCFRHEWIKNQNYYIAIAVSPGVIPTVLDPVLDAELVSDLVSGLVLGVKLVLDSVWVL